MARATNSIVINQPIKDIFNYIADGTNDLHWRKDMVLSEHQNTETGLGAIYKRVIHGPLGGWQRLRQDYKITTYDSPHILSYVHVKGLARPTGKFELSEASANSTKVAFTIEWRPKSAIGDMINGMLEQQFKADVGGLEKLKQLLEK